MLNPIKGWPESDAPIDHLILWWDDDTLEWSVTIDGDEHMTVSQVTALVEMGLLRLDL